MNRFPNNTDYPNRPISWCYSPSSFTGKELDSETGYSYFGARYYDAELSGLFFSVDPMADKYPNMSSYAYCAWNPVKITDPNGDSIKIQYKDININYYSGMSYTGNDDFVQKTIGYLNDMANTSEGSKVIDKLISSSISYTYTSSVPSTGKAVFNEKKLIFEMGDATALDYAHETFHAYQYEYGMVGQTATREVGAKIFEAIMSDRITSWGYHNPTLVLCGGIDYSNSMVSLFLDGFDFSRYSQACHFFLEQSPAGPDFNSQGYTVGKILTDPPIKEILDIFHTKKNNR